MSDKFCLNKDNQSTVESLSISCFDSIAAVGRQRWDNHFQVDNPFLQFDYLLALESSGCVTEGSGWKPCHLLIESDSDSWLLPGYEKSHSWGEYVFDFEWARAYQHYGKNYYPKWICAIPFTPSVGPRIGHRVKKAALHSKGPNFAVISEWAKSRGYSSWHLLFAGDRAYLNSSLAQAIARHGVQYHWKNPGFSHFDEFLAALNKKGRKRIRQERLKISQQGVRCRWLLEQQATQFLSCEFYPFYARTYIKRSGHQGYLNADFFKHIATTMAQNLAVCIAEVGAGSEKQIVAAALFFYDNSKLYGRYWGAKQNLDCLHFELCYYQGIDFAIQRGLKVFDAGAQGEHKLSRGFEPVLTHSFCEIFSAEFRGPISHYCEEENQLQQQWMQQARRMLPYKSA